MHGAVPPIATRLQISQVAIGIGVEKQSMSSCYTTLQTVVSKRRSQQRDTFP